MTIRWKHLLPCLVLVLFIIVENQGQVFGRCFHKPEKRQERHLYYKGHDLPITIDVSDRPSHRLVSHVLKILLEEEVGYVKVVLRQGSNYSVDPIPDLLRLAGCIRSKNRRCNVRRAVPSSMINLELWLKAGYSLEPWIKAQYVRTAGPLGPSGRFGWFMPSSVVDASWRKEQLILDHWRSFTTDKVSRKFHLGDRQQLLRHYLTKKNPAHPVTKRNYCQGAFCSKNGMSKSNVCQKKPCAVLLTSYQALDNGSLVAQVERLNLSVQVAWVGPHLEGFVSHQAKRGEPVLFYNWTPNKVTATGNYTRVKFPSCHSDSCYFETHQLTKVTWSKLQNLAPEVFSLVSHMEFKDEQYEDMLQLLAAVRTESEEAYAAAACSWLQTNRQAWHHWIPHGLGDRAKIYLGGLFPITGPYFRAPGIIPGALMALEAINRNLSILPGYELKLSVKDTKCKSDIVVKQFMKFISNTPVKISGILGPGCSETAVPIAGVAKHFNMVMISYSAEAVQLSNRAIYPLFFRTVPQMAQQGDVYVDMFRRFGWKQVALLAEDGREFPEFHAYLQDLFLSNDIHVVYHRKMPRQSTPEDAQKYVEAIKAKNAKIIIVTSYEVSMRAVFCEAYRQGMTGKHGYMWFLPAWFTQTWWNTDYFNMKKKDSPNENVPCTTRQMERAVQGHMILTNAIFGRPESHIVGNVTVKKWVQLYRNRLRVMREHARRIHGAMNTSYAYIEESPYASYAYDATWTYALGLDKLLKEDPSALESLHTANTTLRLMYHLNRTHFVGASGPVRFNGADRAGIVNIDQFYNKSSNLIGQYMPDRNQSERLILNMSRVIWVSGEKPDDGRKLAQVCSVEAFRRFLGVSCETAIVIANVLGVGFFGVIMIVSLIVVKRRYDSKVRATRRRMQELGLMYDTTWLCLDQWEIQREHVVLNRKLGEGAFGTVYGGEALVGDVWEAVAVKTLKVGSTAEEKLDFLSEAEMMKRFDHENIVKLLGVCTRGEPAYTIMEFMLHGDLKTFLLGRRQLVGEPGSEAEEARPARLTRMALDIAEGLKYLSDSKYVHRDLACRNCLVHSSKSVKIGDFGMTRPVYESDYYRFNKRGMLPVRWMAPESLTDGIFACSSDIWSYGILLYEIVTFGSFPYQGLSNKQVLEYVKNGNTIVLPNACNDDLRTLLQSCWAYTPECRPSVDELLTILTKQQELLVPCLDAPLSAVQNSDSSLELFTIPSAKPRQRGAARFSSSSAEHSHTVRPSASCERSFSQFSSQRSPSPSSVNRDHVVTSRDNIHKIRVVSSGSKENLSKMRVTTSKENLAAKSRVNSGDSRDSLARRESLQEHLRSLCTGSRSTRPLPATEDELQPLTARLSLSSRQSSDDRTESSHVTGPSEGGHQDHPAGTSPEQNDVTSPADELSRAHALTNGYVISHRRPQVHENGTAATPRDRDVIVDLTESSTDDTKHPGSSLVRDKLASNQEGELKEGASSKPMTSRF